MKNIIFLLSLILFFSCKKEEIKTYSLAIENIHDTTIIINLPADPGNDPDSLPPIIRFNSYIKHGFVPLKH